MKTFERESHILKLLTDNLLESLINMIIPK
jgi:hypothetical protein